VRLLVVGLAVLLLVVLVIAMRRDER